MPSRSWMAALVLSSLLVPTALSRGDEPVSNTVRLQLLITGLGPEGCKLEIRPSHPGCRFDPVKRKVEGGTRDGMNKLEPIELNAVSLGADHDCSFTITLSEPGQPPRVYHRGIRLLPPGTDGKAVAQNVRLYLTSPSLAAREEEGRTRR